MSGRSASKQRKQAQDQKKAEPFQSPAYLAQQWIDRAEKIRKEQGVSKPVDHRCTVRGDSRNAAKRPATRKQSQTIKPTVPQESVPVSSD